MSLPVVSVITETITARSGGRTNSLATELAPNVKALEQQTYPRQLIEHIIVLDKEIDTTAADELCRRYPSVKFVSTLRSHYLVAKNAGAAAASGDIIALVDGDCEPEPDWIEMLVRTFNGNNVAAVAGRTYYTGGSGFSRTFSVPDFNYILTEDNNESSGFNISNVAFRRQVILEHPFDTRLPRNGGCYFLYHQLRAQGARILHQPRARVGHALDFEGLGFFRKHFERGYDGVRVYYLDNDSVLRGTRVLRRFGFIGLAGITLRRILIDWKRLIHHRRQIGVSIIALPYFAFLGFITRLIELTGGLSAIISRRSHS